MKELVFSLIVFVIIYLFYLFFVILRKKKVQKIEGNTYIMYLISVYGLKIEKVNMKVLINLIALSNAFILSSTLFIISFVDNFILKMLLGFIVLFPIQYLIYHLIGKMYQKSGQAVKVKRKK